MDLRSLTRRRLLAAGGAVALLAGAGVAVIVSNAEHGHRPAAAATPSPTLTPSVAVQTSQPPPPAAPVRRTVAHDFVAPAAPTSFVISGRGFTIRARVCAMPAIFPLDPPGDQRHTVCWVRDGFGFKPGSHTATSYVLGHSWAEDPQEVLNAASSRATRDVLRAKRATYDGVPIFPAKSLLGARITLQTPTGTLGYVVRKSFGVDKYQLGNIDRVMNQRVPNRVVVITCAEHNGVDYNYNIVLEAQLVSSQARVGADA
ncbi:MAG TPA: hypothetical protein VKB75_11010 [Jatrophihabitans sp.]|nr:hypothetical protein [Jatrophihabitans sp.]